MEPRHRNIFLSRLERVLTHGVAEVHREEIKLWFNQTRVARRTWRRIAELWEDVVETPEVDKLIVGGINGENWVFAIGTGMGTSDNSFFVDVRYLAGSAEADGTIIDSEIAEDIAEVVGQSRSRRT